MAAITKEYLLAEMQLMQQKLLQATMEHFACEGAVAYIERLLEQIDSPTDALSKGDLEHSLGQFIGDPVPLSEINKGAVDSAPGKAQDESPIS